MIKKFIFDGKYIDAQVSFKCVYHGKELDIVCYVKAPATVVTIQGTTRKAVKILSIDDLGNPLLNNLTNAQAQSIYQQLNNHGQAYTSLPDD